MSPSGHPRPKTHQAARLTNRTPTPRHLAPVSTGVPEKPTIRRRPPARNAMLAAIDDPRASRTRFTVAY
jgi:hypothetical protein